MFQDREGVPTVLVKTTIAQYCIMLKDCGGRKETAMTDIISSVNLITHNFFLNILSLVYIMQY